MQNIKKKMVMTGSSLLLEEMIVEILSWLPNKSLLRFKCVCKLWCSTIEHPKFIVMHMSRAPSTIRAFKLKTPEFAYITYCQSGLILEKNKLTNAYRVRNPATRQILNLPGPPEQPGHRADVCYIPATNDLKFVYMHYLEEESAENSSRCMLVYDVLRAGSSDHLTWKRLDSPSFCKRTRSLPVGVIIGTVLYCVKKGLMSELLMDCVDLESEEIKSTISIPSKSFLNGTKNSIMVWNGKPCLAHTVVEKVTSQEEQLSVWVFDKYNNHEGGADSRRFMIPLKFMKDYPWMSKANISPLRVEGNQMTWLFREGDSRAMFNVDMESHEVKVLASTTEEEKMALCHYKPTLVHVKGMQTEQ